LGRALSPAVAPADAAAWIEGFTGGTEPGGGLLLLHDERLLGLIDTWLTGAPADAFTDVLPLLRRTFSGCEPALRRALGERIRNGPAGGAARGSTAPAWDPERAAAVLPTMRLLLGLDEEGEKRESRRQGQLPPEAEEMEGDVVTNAAGSSGRAALAGGGAR
ncbi:DUF5682 family protein, partial [Streptomyces huiliensis]|uniref:DUF5682 family protein n=1 Tax=Streptomyces huiliensis TaxID=2876027 RepID=UPI001CC0E02F